MALTFPNSPSSGTTYLDDNQVLWQYDGVKWDVITGSSKKAFNGAKLSLGSDFTTSTVLGDLLFDVEQFDTAGYFSVLIPGEIKIPDNAYYRINVQVKTGNAGNSNSYDIRVKLNDTLYLSSTLAAPNQYVVYDETIELTKGDFIEVYVAESTGVGTIDADDTFIEITQVGL